MRCISPSLFFLFCLVRVAAESSLRVEVDTDREFYLEQARSTAYLDIRLIAPEPAPVEDRAATRNIVFVLDRSGSMSGPAMQAVRQAVPDVLSALRDRDIVSIVTFGSEVETRLEATRRDQLSDPDSLLAAVEPSGGSALYDALNQGMAQLRRHASRSTVNHLILLTDGPATKGPRGLEDLTKLVEAFARERVTVSTIGVGDEFEEDLLAALARAGSGRFRFAAKPEDIGAALRSELPGVGDPRAHDVSVRIEFAREAEESESYAWLPADAEGTTLIFRPPSLFTGQEVRLLVSVTTRMRRFSFDLARIVLRYTDPATGKIEETVQPVHVMVDTSPEAVRRSMNVAVVRRTVDAVISAAMQRAIEQMDKGDLRGAVRALRRGRSDAYGLNYQVDDPEVVQRIRLLEEYLADVQARGLNQLDRKILRSGLFNQFESPTAEAERTP